MLKRWVMRQLRMHQCKKKTDRFYSRQLAGASIYGTLRGQQGYPDNVTTDYELCKESYLIIFAMLEAQLDHRRNVQIRTAQSTVVQPFCMLYTAEAAFDIPARRAFL